MPQSKFGISLFLEIEKKTFFCIDSNTSHEIFFYICIH